MNDDRAPHSGSRWEPGATEHLVDEGGDILVRRDDPVPDPAPRRPRGRVAVLAATAVCCLAVGGAGGYAIGHATATGAAGSGFAGDGGRGGAGGYDRRHGPSGQDGQNGGLTGNGTGSGSAVSST